MVKKIYVVFYSTWGHIYKLAQKIKEGAEKVEGVEVKIFQIAETLPESGKTTFHSPIHFFLELTTLPPRHDMNITNSPS